MIPEDDRIPCFLMLTTDRCTASVMIVAGP